MPDLLKRNKGGKFFEKNSGTVLVGEYNGVI